MRVPCALSRKTEHSGRPWGGETELSPHLPGRKPMENTRVRKALRSLEGNETSGGLGSGNLGAGGKAPGTEW